MRAEDLIGSSVSPSTEDSVMRTFLQRFGADQSGATAIEYALIAMIVSVAIVSSMQTVGDSVRELFGYIVDSIAPEPQES
jgi:pilus assembly protein Flp/PilA